MGKVIQLTDDIRISKNLRGLVMRLNLMGFKAIQKDMEFNSTSKVYVLKIKGLSRIKKLTSEEIFYLDKNLKSGLSVVIIRKFLGITLWRQIILGDF